MQSETPGAARMSQDPLILTEKRGHVAILTLNRPEA
jgi:enoyl-CoA hydratase/carnithine racemase